MVYEIPMVERVKVTLYILISHMGKKFFGVFSRTNGHKTTIGMTAEIFEYLPEEGNAGFRIKAKARQRFRMLDPKSCCRWKAKVKILPEVCLSDPLENVKLQSLYRHRTSTVNRHRCVIHVY